MLVIPPEAITGMLEARAMATVAATLTPCIMPSRAMSVYTMADTPSDSNRRARSVAFRVETSAQPSVATRPSFASSPTMIRPGKAAQASATKAGSFTALVPIIT